MSRRMRWPGYVARMRQKRNMYRFLFGNSEVKRPLGRQKRRWEDDIEKNFVDKGRNNMDWISLAQDTDQ
jgi:hypothetical protein